MGFFEILLVAVVTLLVVGPERIPETVRTVAMTIGRLKRSINNVREEIEKQVGTDDIRLQLHNEAVMENLEKIKRNLAHTKQAAPEQTAPEQTAPEQIAPEQIVSETAPEKVIRKQRIDPDDSWENEEDYISPTHSSSVNLEETINPKKKALTSIF